MPTLRAGTFKKFNRIIGQAQIEFWYGYDFRP
jgi:hypothetical protein